MSIPFLIYSAAFLAWVLLLSPSLMFLVSTWGCRRDRLWDFLTGESLRHYYSLFKPDVAFPKDSEYVVEFRRSFTTKYGRHHFAIPVALLGVTSFLALWAVADSTIAALMTGPRLVELPALAIAAIMGAYLWILWDQLSRFRSRDFTIHDIYGCTLRLVIAVPLAASLSALANVAVQSAIAFLLGAFPMREIMKLARRLGGKSLGLDQTADDGPTELVKLQGISRAVAERFQEEGITTISQLAWTEPVDLAIRTNFDFDYVLDCQSQALLWAYFEDNSRKLIPFMMRGAMEVAEMLGAPKDGGPNLAMAPRATIREAAAAIGINEEAFGQTLIEVARDPYTQILCSIWYPEWFANAEQARRA